MNDIKEISLLKSLPLEQSLLDPAVSLSPEQQYAYSQFIRGENLFITGPGGTGKTRLVKQFSVHAKKAGKHIPVCAMTGCAAVLLQCNATTLHSWSGIKLAKGSKENIIRSVIRNTSSYRAWRKAKGLILDEVSMLSKKVFEIIEELARTIKKTNVPFGGMQVVFTGDFFQLPPVGDAEDEDSDRFCFESARWSAVFRPENQIELTTMFRQTDPEYIHILNQIRIGNLQENSCAILKERLNRVYDSTTGCVPTKLFALRTKTDFINQQMFAKIKEPEFVFEIRVKTDCTQYLESGKPIETSKMCQCLEMSMHDQEMELEMMKRNILACPPIVRLKKGAVVMCVVNLDMEQGICNGSQGVVVDLCESWALVHFSNDIVKRIVPYYWQSETYPTLAIGQLPLCLAWAVTIHKIQGATLSMAEIDIGNSIFEYGQTYVALSRVQSLQGLYLTSFDAQKIKANPIVVAFYRDLARHKK